MLKHRMNQRIPKLLFKISLLLVSIGAIFAVVEILCRVYLAPDIGHHSFFTQYHEMLGWAHIPKLKGWHITGEYEVLEKYNSEGIRGPEYSHKKSAGEYRIVVLGDSFAEGYSVQFSELFSEVLKTELNNRRDKQYEVINTGTGGYSTDQELLLFQTAAKKYRPDLTILMFWDNDIWFNNQPKYAVQYRGYKPFFKLDHGRLVLTNVPVPRPPTIQRANEKRSRTTQSGGLKEIKSWLSENTDTYKAFRRMIRNIPFLYAATIRLGLTERDTKLSHPMAFTYTKEFADEFRVWKKTYDTEVVEAWKITEALLRKLKEETRSIGSEFLVFYIPTRAAVYADVWEATKRKFAISDENWDIDRVSIELAEICKRNGIDCINPSDAFRAEGDRLEQEGKRLYFVEDVHLNKEGHKLVGEILMEYISARYLEVKERLYGVEGKK